jgi:hypothetical protein
MRWKFVLIAVVAAVESASALQSLAALAGHTGYSASLSSNAAIRKQQLICDPTDPDVGSTSTQYDPELVELTRIDPIRFSATDGYLITSALVQVADSSGQFGLLMKSVPVGQDFSIANQIGYVQVRYKSTTTPTGIADGPLPGFTLMAKGGVDGTDTHSLIFNVLPNTPDDVPLSYANYADVGGKEIQGGGTTQPDTLQAAGGQPIGPAGLTTAIVSAALLPEPASAAVFAIAGMGMLVRRRRSRASR